MFITLTEQALVAIKERGLNQIRCSLTGAPYATVTDDEIELTLDGDILSAPKGMSVDRLIDNWELRALTLNSNPAPALRGLKEKSLVPFLQRGHRARLFTYLLTRLLYPRADEKSESVDYLRERMLFAIECYESVKVWNAEMMDDFVQQMLAIDSYCAMPYWHKIWVFNSPLSKMGMRNSKEGDSVRSLFLLPSPDFTPDSISDLLNYMFKLMLYAAEIDSNAGYPGNRFASAALQIEADAPDAPHIPHFQKQLSQADIDRIEMQKRVAAKDELRIAHSAIHGKGILPGEAVGGSQRATTRTKSDRLWDMIADSKGVARKKAQSAPKPKAKKTPKPGSLDALFNSAVNALGSIKFEK